MNYTIHQWNKEWDKYIQNLLQEENKLKMLLNLSHEGINYLKSNTFKYGYYSRERLFSDIFDDVCKIGFGTADNSLNFVVNSHGNIDCLKHTSAIDNSELTFIEELFEEFGIVAKAAHLIKKEIHPKELTI